MTSRTDDSEIERWTLAAIRERGLELEAACRTPGCGRFVMFDLETLIARVGPDYLLPADGPGLACEGCGGPLEFQLAALHRREG
ncbi:MAG: hypothetical protein AB7I79_20575 [Rhizobiaceae bacterium]